ncbi:MAG TPA: hypothetical protein VFQ61_11020, partial [Polyangiaceae bacterium]|nr:hypothetical protein [Polyangiaceae bacterium]
PGTGAYMSPEQVRGEELDPRADLYSAAVVLYEMVCGTTPFDTGQRDELMLRAAQIEEPPPPLSLRVDGIPGELEMVLARALAKDRRHRFTTALELGEAVRKAMGQAPAANWAAQLEFSALAKTISAAMPQQSDAQIAQRAERLRTAMMSPAR